MLYWGRYTDLALFRVAEIVARDSRLGARNAWSVMGCHVTQIKETGGRVSKKCVYIEYSLRNPIRERTKPRESNLLL